MHNGCDVLRSSRGPKFEVNHSDYVWVGFFAIHFHFLSILQSIVGNSIKVVGYSILSDANLFICVVI